MSPQQRAQSPAPPELPTRVPLNTDGTGLTWNSLMTSVEMINEFPSLANAMLRIG
jgi:hypothetical protein